VDERERLGGVLRALKGHGVRELFLDELDAAQAMALAAGPASVAPAGAGVAPTRAPGAAIGTGLEVLATRVAACERCELSRGRTQVVFGRGNPRADLVVVGEAPGGEEDRTGLPFVGAAGKLLDLLLLAVGFTRDSVYICNVLKCRPPGNRDPRPAEVEQCASHLHAQLEEIGPRALLAVGRFASQMLAGSDVAMAQLRGRVRSYRGIPVVATYHPAYLLRTPEATRKTWRDLQLMRQVLDEQS
jgi:uracil-DNA glycosylase